MTAVSQGTRFLVRARSNGLCQRCGRPGTNIHHRINRGAGGSKDPRLNRLSALVLLCGSGTTGCHGWATENPAAAYATGWSIRRSERDTPDQIPLTDLAGRKFWLTDEGTVIYLNGSAW